MISSDFKQFGPIFNSWKGFPIREGRLEHSRLLHKLCDGNKCVLTECMRSDKDLFIFYSSLLENGSRFELSLRQAVAEAKRQFTFNGVSETNLCISHHKRIIINRQVNRLLAPEHAVFVESTGTPGSHNMYIWAEQKLLGATQSEKKGIKNMVEYTIDRIDIGAKNVYFVGLGAAFTYEQIAKWLRLPYCRTYASIQGHEVDGPLVLWDCGHIYFTRRHLYVRLSRGKRAEHIGIRN